MHDRRRHRIGDLGGEPARCLDDVGDLAGSVPGPELREPPHLPFEVVAGAHERREARRLHITPVNLGENGDHVLPQPAAGALVPRQRRWEPVRDDLPADEVHHVERHAEHTVVLADPTHRGHPHAKRSEGELQPGLARDVVRRRWVGRTRRTAEDEALVTPLDQEREVRFPFADDGRVERPGAEPELVEVRPHGLDHE